MMLRDNTTPFPEKIRIGVSACLLGNQVRFDGGHKRSRFIVDELADYLEFVPFCPEVAIGLGVPRQPIRLVGDVLQPRAVGVRNSDLDVSQPLRDYGKKVAAEIDGLSGFILKKDSPSCGMERVKIYSEKGMPERVGSGLFAREIISANPLLPVEEEGRLNDVDLRENFVTRVYVYARWKQLREENFSKAALLSFHASHKYLVLAHSTVSYARLGRLLSDMSKASLEDIADRYIDRLMHALSLPTTRKRHTNVLHHLLGYLKRDLDSVHRLDLAESIEAYRRGEFPLVVPLRLLQHHFTIFRKPYIDRQVYMNPYPRSLKLRNNL